MRRQLVEEGTAFEELEGAMLATRAAKGIPFESGGGPPSGPVEEPERRDVIVIGGGQAGLSVGYHLARHGLNFVILDDHERTGDSWRTRWDSLRLFTPAVFAGLDGMPFPAPPFTFPTKDGMADYLESYARHFALPVHHGVKVDRLAREGDLYVATAGSRRFEASQVVVAMANYQIPRVPSLAGQLDGGIVQLHSYDYRNPAQLREGDVLIVGGGNSGADIAMDLAGSHRVWLAGRDTGHVPFRIEGLAARLVLARFMLRFVFHRVLTLSTPLGRRARREANSKGAPLIRIKPADLAAAGVQRVPRMSGVTEGRPRLEDGHVLEVANVIWCTGFSPGFSWINLPIFDAQGEPEHERGVVRREPGLYFVGLHFLYAFSSSMIHGVGRDAKHVVGALVARTHAAGMQTHPSGSRSTEIEEGIAAMV